MAVPLAERCERVYGLDVSEEVLAEADRNAKHAGVSNVDWRDAGRLPELDGLYDLVISMYVFQHIPPREGERILEQIVRGLRPGGAGILQFVLRPPIGEVVGPHPLWRAYGYWHSYSLNRIGSILARAGGVYRWQVNWQGKEGRPDDAVVLVFEKKPSNWVGPAPD